ncbi:hypothetical protein [Leeuwenhoekiella sp. ZYFB001]|uniref:hypothetical protein n=1 Tax=Leeuwenhoekiella sp. ZYFB001 TaxID=2719912 RepID=UPI0014303B79|nr:hypothetical protein [Leeuwenhoekiella sp. ZYFB001]
MKQLFNHIYSRIKEINFEENELCKQYWLKIERLNANFSDQDAMELLFDNIEWLINTEVVTGLALKKLGNGLLMKEAGIYFGGEVKIHNRQAILFGDTKAIVTGHSRIRAFDNSEVEADDSTFVSVYHNSKVDAKNCKIQAFNKAQVKSRGFCLIEDYTDGGKIVSGSKDLVY